MFKTKTDPDSIIYFLVSILDQSRTFFFNFCVRLHQCCNESKMFGWGRCEAGQLGLGGVTDLEINCPQSVTQIPISGQCPVFKDVKTGDSHSVILSNDGKVLTCGSNEYGQVWRFRVLDYFLLHFVHFSLVTKA